MSTPPHLTTSVIKRGRAFQTTRSLQKVPYVELFGGRVQGVVSSGSDPARVYVSWFSAEGDFDCSTNNNRPCSGARGCTCGHIGDMLNQAIAQYGGDAVARYLGIADKIGGPCRTSYDIMRAARGTQRKGEGGAVFARFLNYLRYTELDAGAAPLPEMAFFITG